MRLLFDADVRDLSAVTSPVLFSGQNKPHPQGIFSEVIFGNTRGENRKNKAVIDLQCKVIHPVIYSLMKKALRGPIVLAEKLKSFKLENGRVIECSDKDPNKKMGIPGFLSLVEEVIKEKKDEGVYFKTLSRLLKKYPEYTITKMIVIPPEFRPYINGKSLSPLNDLYVKLIKQTLSMSKVENDTTSDLYAIRVTIIQKTVNEIFDFVSAKVPKDLRGNIEAKRVDFSARLVITGDPSIPVGYVGVPLRVAVKLSEPFILYLAKQRSIKMTLSQIVEKIQLISKGIEIPAGELKIIKSLTEDAVKDKYVLIKRDPSLHALSWQSYKVKLVDDLTLHLNPVYVSGFNADFDGDQMAVYLPITMEGQNQAKKLTQTRQFANPYGGSKYQFDKDYAFAICISTSDPERGSSYWFWKKTKYNKIDTTEGRYRLYKPIEGKIPFKEVNKRIDANWLVTRLTDILSQQELEKYITFLVNFSVEVLNSMVASIDVNDLQVDPGIEKMLKQLDPKDPEFPQKSLKIQLDVIKKLTNSKSDLAKFLKCGVLKTTQYQQLVGVKGVVADTSTGNVSNIKGNFSDGLTPTQYFDASLGARTGVAARSLMTSKPGHLHRKLAFALSSVRLDSTLKDCGTTRTLKIKVTPDLVNKLIGRYAYVDGKLLNLNQKTLQNLVGNTIELRSPIFCKSPKVCQICYGDSWKIMNTTEVGFIAAESLGERMMQATMRVFHTGGVTQIVYPDPIKDSEINTGRDYPFLIYQSDKHTVITKEEINLRLSKEYYNFRYSDESPMFPVDMLMGEILSKDKEIPFVVDNPIELNVHDLSDSSTEYIVHYNKGDIVLKALQETSEAIKKINKLIAITEGRTQFYDVGHFLMKMYKNLRVLGNVSLVHLEVLLSQLLRDKLDLSKPARLGRTWDPTLVSISKIPQLESWVRAVEFERFKDGLVESLLHKENVSESVLDQMYFM